MKIEWQLFRFPLDDKRWKSKAAVGAILGMVGIFIWPLWLIYSIFLAIKAYQGERRALIDLRRVGCWYLRSNPGTKKLREEINRCKSLRDAEALILNYEWEEAAVSA